MVNLRISQQKKAMITRLWLNIHAPTEQLYVKQYSPKNGEIILQLEESLVVISYHIGTSDYLEKENNPHSYPVPPFSRREDDYDSWIQTISEDGSVSTSGISNTPNYEGIINGIHTFNPNPPYNDFF